MPGAPQTHQQPEGLQEVSAGAGRVEREGCGGDKTRGLTRGPAWSAL